MSYFDGIIPKACRSCFTWNGQNWVQTDPAYVMNATICWTCSRWSMGTRSENGKRPLIAEDVRTPLELTRMAGVNKRERPLARGLLPSTIVQLVYKNPSLVQASRRPL